METLSISFYAFSQSRMQEEKLRQEREKQVEMSKKCLERSMGDVKKIVCHSKMDTTIFYSAM